jgi:hypothetical protein
MLCAIPHKKLLQRIIGKHFFGQILGTRCGLSLAHSTGFKKIDGRAKYFYKHAKGARETEFLYTCRIE